MNLAVELDRRRFQFPSKSAYTGVSKDKPVARSRLLTLRLFHWSTISTNTELERKGNTWEMT
jgi:hypothetical protein